MTAPRFHPGDHARDFATGFVVTVIEALSAFHPKTGQRLYLTRSRTGRERRLQERNLKPLY